MPVTRTFGGNFEFVALRWFASTWMSVARCECLGYRPRTKYRVLVSGSRHGTTGYGPHLERGSVAPCMSMLTWC